MILGVPFSGGGLGKTKGVELAPAIILDTLKDCTNEFGRFKHFFMELIKLDNSNISESLNSIYSAVLDKSPKLVLGGDHTITYPSMKAFCKKNQNAGILVFDAHPDLMQPFSVPTHENYLRQLIEDGIVKKENVVLVGVRAWDKEEVAYVKRNKLKVYPMRELAKEGLRVSCDAVMAAAREFESLYISIDIDVLDPAFAPGTGNAEPGGLSTRELLYFLHRLLLLKNLKMVDVVEFKPDADVNDQTLNVVKKIIEEVYLNR